MTDTKKVGGVAYATRDKSYFEERGLTRYAGIWSLWALGVGAVISGHFSGWNFGFATGGWGGMMVAAGIIAIMYLGLVFCIAEMSPALPHTGAAYSFARTSMGPWGGFITGEKDYPYVSGDGQVPACQRQGKPARAHITGHVNVANSESEMATAVATIGPLSIAVDASTWQTYSGGIMTNCASTQVDHGVLIVGYDLSYSTPYWIIKNSWTPQWGEHGYIRVEYGRDECLITSTPGYPRASRNLAIPRPPTE